jgi:hypothetical protein
MISDLKVDTFIILESRHKSIATSNMTMNILTCFMKPIKEKLLGIKKMQLMHM